MWPAPYRLLFQNHILDIGISAVLIWCTTQMKVNDAYLFMVFVAAVYNIIFGFTVPLYNDLFDQDGMPESRTPLTGLIAAVGAALYFAFFIPLFALCGVHNDKERLKEWSCSVSDTPMWIVVTKTILCWFIALRAVAFTCIGTVAERRHDLRRSIKTHTS